MEAHICGPSIYDPDDKSEQRKRAAFSANGVGATEHPQRGKKKMDTLLHSVYKTQFLVNYRCRCEKQHFQIKYGRLSLGPQSGKALLMHRKYKLQEEMICPTARNSDLCSSEAISWRKILVVLIIKATSIESVRLLQIRRKTRERHELALHRR